MPAAIQVGSYVKARPHRSYWSIVEGRGIGVVQNIEPARFGRGPRFSVLWFYAPTTDNTFLRHAWNTPRTFVRGMARSALRLATETELQEPWTKYIALCEIGAPPIFVEADQRVTSEVR